MFEKILVPLDLGPKSTASVEAAHEFAKKTGSEVLLLHVIETVEHIQFDEMKDFYLRLEESAQRGLDEFSEMFREDNLRVDTLVVYGKRGMEIVNCAIENRIDLIILASHRVDPDRPGHDWSSISYAVAIMAPCAVLLVK